MPFVSEDCRHVEQRENRNKSEVVRGARWGRGEVGTVVCELSQGKHCWGVSSGQTGNGLENK